MSKLSLYYFLSVGGELVSGDTYIGLDGDIVTVVHPIITNERTETDSRRFIESFAPRKNEGVTPCDGNLPFVGHWFIDGVDDYSSGLAKHFDWDIVDSDNCEIEFWQPDLAALIKMQDEHDATLSKTEKVEAKPSVYTQAMADAGELPEVGMEFLVANDDPGSRIIDFSGKTVKVISTCRLGNRDVITFSHKVMGVGCGCYCKSWVKPIDTRTEKEKVIDGILYDIEDRINNCDNPNGEGDTKSNR